MILMFLKKTKTFCPKQSSMATSQFLKTTRSEHILLAPKKLFLLLHTWHRKNVDSNMLHLSCTPLTGTLDFQPYHLTLSEN